MGTGKKHGQSWSEKMQAASSPRDAGVEDGLHEASNDSGVDEATRGNTAHVSAKR